MPAPKKPRPVTPEARGRAEGYRSGLEDLVANQLKAQAVNFTYEGYPLKYLIPARYAKYTADFVLPNGIIVETKGRFVTADRKKHTLIREQFPELDIRFVFSNPNDKIGKKSKTTYAMWCDRLGLRYAKRLIPQEWIDEKPLKWRIDAALKALNWKPPA